MIGSEVSRWQGRRQPIGTRAPLRGRFRVRRRGTPRRVLLGTLLRPSQVHVNRRTALRALAWDRLFPRAALWRTAQQTRMCGPRRGRTWRTRHSSERSPGFGCPCRQL